MTFAFLVWFSSRSRAGLPLPRWVTPAAIGSVALTIGTIGTYNHQIKKLWDEIKDDWLAHEGMLDQDPRSGLPS